MTWHTSADVHSFLAVAGDFLGAHPVEHTALLTEAAYLQARPSTAPDQLYGWWLEPSGAVTGAFLQAPAHPPILSLVPPSAISELPAVLGSVEAIGVDGRFADAVAGALELRERSRITLYRLAEFVPPAYPPGQARVAVAADRELLLSWFHALMAAYPGDPSEAAYVVDDPLTYGGITLWERDGTPVAMAGRSRLAAGMVRLSAVYAPADSAHAEAAFAAATSAAASLAEHVLVFGSTEDSQSRELGYKPVLDRVMLARP